MRLVLRVLRDIRHLGPRYMLSFFYVLSRAKLYPVHIPGFGWMTVRNPSSDIDVIRQIFIAKQYDLSVFRQNKRIMDRYEDIIDRKKIPVVIDAGANNGASAMWFARNFSKAMIVALEPDHDNFLICKKNTSLEKRVVLLEAAIGGSPGFVTLDDSSGSSWAVQSKRCEGEHPNSVRLESIGSVMEARPDEEELFMVKMDIEGFEEDVFSQNLNWLDGISALLIETHDRLMPGRYSSAPLQRAIAARRFEILISGDNLIYVR